jgi:hypothetical protein
LTGRCLGLGTSCVSTRRRQCNCSCLFLSLTCLSRRVPCAVHRYSIFQRCAAGLSVCLSLGVCESASFVCFSVGISACSMRVTECECVARRCQNESSPSWQQQWPCPPLLLLVAILTSPCFIEPYNATLSVHQVVKIADECMYMIGNEALPTSASVPCNSPPQPMVTSTTHLCSACIYVCLPTASAPLVS